jgi:putative ABC transport system substrate-binding protein
LRRIGVLMNLASDDAEAQARVAAFQQSLQRLGWSDGRNVRIDSRWAAGDAERTRRYAAELIALAPDSQCRESPGRLATTTPGTQRL